MRKKHKVVIAGSGGMGSAAALLLRELGDFDVDVALGDANEARAREAAAWVHQGSSRPGEVDAFLLPAEGSSAAFESRLAGADILLDCLPGHEAPRMARLARQHGLHYANLTEHVKETEEIQEIAAGAEQGFLLQTGLAPGFVNVLGMSLLEGFFETHGVQQADRLAMRVGALTRIAPPPHYYGFTWSSIGVATEYVEPATVIRDFERTQRPSLTELETVVVDGLVLEEALTSGGAADLVISLAGKVRDVDYKTLRYPGHYAWIQGLLAGMPAGDDLPGNLLRQMETVVPFVDADDLVVIYAAVEGRDAHGVLRRSEKLLSIPPSRVGARTLRAIQSTTAAGLAESARLLLLGKHRGVCLQSQIDPAQFLSGPFVSAIYLGTDR